MTSLLMKLDVEAANLSGGGYGGMDRGHLLSSLSNSGGGMPFSHLHNNGMASFFNNTPHHPSHNNECNNDHTPSHPPHSHHRPLGIFSPSRSLLTSLPPPCDLFSCVFFLLWWVVGCVGVTVESDGGSYGLLVLGSQRLSLLQLRVLHSHPPPLWTSDGLLTEPHHYGLSSALLLRDGGRGSLLLFPPPQWRDRWKSRGTHLLPPFPVTVAPPLLPSASHATPAGRDRWPSPRPKGRRRRRWWGGGGQSVPLPSSAVLPLSLPSHGAFLQLVLLLTVAPSTPPPPPFTAAPPSTAAPSPPPLLSCPSLLRLFFHSSFQWRLQ